MTKRIYGWGGGQNLLLYCHENNVHTRINCDTGIKRKAKPHTRNIRSEHVSCYCSATEIVFVYQANIFFTPPAASFRSNESTC